jgi:hypothetical protein
MDATRFEEAAWLFIRGQQSVRMLRVTDAAGRLHLIVHGPGPVTVIHGTDDLVESMAHQANLGRELLAEDFRIVETTSDRRSGRDRRSTPRRSDRRRDH